MLLKLPDLEKTIPDTLSIKLRFSDQADASFYMEDCGTIL